MITLKEEFLVHQDRVYAWEIQPYLGYKFLVTKHQTQLRKMDWNNSEWLGRQKKIMILEYLHGMYSHSIKQTNSKSFLQYITAIMPILPSYKESDGQGVVSWKKTLHFSCARSHTFGVGFLIKKQLKSYIIWLETNQPKTMFTENKGKIC